MTQVFSLYVSFKSSCILSNSNFPNIEGLLSNADQFDQSLDALPLHMMLASRASSVP
jgi:hypothetical protein